MMQKRSSLQNAPVESYVTEQDGSCSALADMLAGIPIPASTDNTLKVPAALFNGRSNLIDWLNDKIQAFRDEATTDESASIFTIFPANPSEGTALHEVAVTKNIAACQLLTMVEHEEVLGAGFGESGSSFCAAVNPCEHTYAFGQDRGSWYYLYGSSLTPGMFVKAAIDAVGLRDCMWNHITRCGMEEMPPDRKWACTAIGLSRPPPQLASGLRSI